MGTGRGSFEMNDHGMARGTRWALGVGSTVVAGAVLALLIWIGQTGIEQVRTQAATNEQIRSLTQQVAQLREALAGVPALRDELSTVKAHQEELQRRVGKLEDLRR